MKQRGHWATQILNTLFATTSTAHYYTFFILFFVNINASSNLDRSDLSLLGLSLFLSLLSNLRHVLSGLASPLHLFLSSSYPPLSARPSLPPATGSSFPQSLIRTQETCLSLHPAMGCRDRTRWRLRALAFQHVAACVYVVRVQAGCAHRNTESLTISHSLLLVFSQSSLSLLLSLRRTRLVPFPPRLACPFKRTLVAKFSSLTFPSKYLVLERATVTQPRRAE